MQNIRSHLRIVSAFIIREIATRFDGPGGYLWTILEPVVFIAMMTTLIGAISHIPPIGSSFALFYATGYLGYSIFKSMETYLSSSVSANKALMSYPIVAPLDAVVSRLILQGGTTLLVTVIVIYGALLTVRHPTPLNWLAIIEAFALAWSFALGLALINIVLFTFSPMYEKIYQIASRPLLLLSGVFYVPSMMPHPFQDILLYNPIVHIIILFRMGFYGPAGSHGFDMKYVAILAATALALGMVLFTRFDVSKHRN